MLIERGDLVDAALMAAAGKRRVEERVDDAGALRPAASARSPSARTLASLCSRLSRRRRFVDDRRGADAGDLVGGDRHADARAAEEHAAVERAGRDGACDR